MRTLIHLLCSLTVAWLSIVSQAEAGHGSYGGWGGPPSSTRQMVARVQGEKIELWYAVSRFVPETRTRIVHFQIDGQPVSKEESYTVMNRVMEQKVRQEQLAKVKAFDAARQPVAAARLSKLLAEGRPVLVCDAGEKVDGVYLKLVRPDTLVLMLPPPEVVIYAAPVAPTSPPAGGEVAPAEPSPAAPAEENGVPPAVEAFSPPPAEEPADLPQLPQGQSPSAQQAALTKEGRIRLRTVSNVSQETTANYWHGAEGAEMELAPTTIRRTFRQEAAQEFDPATVRGLTAAGKKLSAGELAKRLAQETPVLVSADGRDIDPEHLRIIRDDALILLAPTLDATPFVFPGGAPVPEGIPPTPEGSPGEAPPQA